MQLSQGDEPFNLTMLTVDTHFEDGYVCEQCPTEYDTQYSNVMACSSRQVGEFLKWIQQQDFYENTTIVISGDHPTMDSDYCAEIDQEGNYDRRVLRLISMQQPMHRISRKEPIQPSTISRQRWQHWAYRLMETGWDLERIFSRERRRYWKNLAIVK